MDFTLPELGEQIESGDVLRVLVKAGDAIAKEQPVLELETDKATIEVPSSVAGTVKDIKVKAGDKVKVGQAIFSYDGSFTPALSGLVERSCTSTSGCPSSVSSTFSAPALGGSAAFGDASAVAGAALASAFAGASAFPAAFGATSAPAPPAAPS